MVLTYKDVETLQDIRVKATDEQLSKVMEVFSMEISRRNRLKALGEGLSIHEDVE